MSDALVWIAIGLAGGIGAVARFAVDAAVGMQLRRRFPFGTLVVNLTGAVALGLLIGVAMRGDALVVAATGVIGSYTTFSTWMFESHRLTEDGEWRLGAGNIALSIAAGVAAVAAGRATGGLL